MKSDVYEICAYHGTNLNKDCVLCQRVLRHKRSAPTLPDLLQELLKSESDWQITPVGFIRGFMSNANAMFAHNATVSKLRLVTEALEEMSKLCRDYSMDKITAKLAAAIGGKKE